jgi:DNA-directed RNA polymerase specialized sigma24 family protein
VTSAQPDAELILSSRSDPAAFAGIFDRHHAELYRYLRRRVGAGVAADLAAETFVTAFSRRGAFRADTTDARPWLYGIAHNLLRNHLRAERRQFAAYARHGAGPLADPDASAAFATADARADSAMVSRTLAQILATMPRTGAVLGTATLVGSTVSCPPGDEYAALGSGYVNSKHQLPPGARRSLKPVSWPHSAAGCPPPTSGQATASPSPAAPSA